MSIPNVVEGILKDSYRPGVSDIIKMVPLEAPVTGEPSAAQIARVINKRLEQYDISVRPQYVLTWEDANSGKINKGGLGLVSQVALGLGAKFSDDPAIAGGMVAMKLFGLWDSDRISVVEMEALAKNGFRALIPSSAPDIDSQLRRIEKKLDRLIVCQGGDQDFREELLKLVKGYSLDDIKAVALETFNARSAERLMEIFSGYGEPMLSADWFEVAYIVTKVTGNPVTPDDLRQLTTTFVEAQHSLV